MRLRGRVFRYVAAAALISCALTVAVGIVLVRRQVSRQRLAALGRQAAVVAVVGLPPGAQTPGEHVYAVGNHRPRPLPAQRAALVLAQIRNRRDGQGQITVADRQLLYAARGTAAGGIVLVRPARLFFAEWRPFLWSVLLSGLGGALIAALISWLLARRLTGPIGALSAATRRLAAGAPEVTVPVSGEDELAQLGRSFNQMAAELAAARDSQREFLESVSHELKTPLTSIRGYAEALADGAVAPAQVAAVLGSEAGRLERLVADLLDLARLQRAGFTVEPAALDLAEVLALVVERHLPQARALGITLERQGSAPAPALADRDRLLQAISNLVENALRLTPTGGTVTLRSAPGLVTVSDTGPGLAAEDLPRAFDRFYLHERYRSERAVGSGLGLAIVSQLAALMGGAVSVSSAPGAGARFTLTLPTAGGRPSAPAPAPQPA